MQYKIIHTVMKLDSCENEVINFDGETGRVGLIKGLKGKLTASND